MIRSPLVATSLTALAAALLLAPAPGSDKDYTNIPPAPAEVKAHIDAASVTLARAVEAACKKTGAGATSAKLSLVEGQPVFEVRVYTAEKGQIVRVDGQGEIMNVVDVPAFQFPGAPLSGSLTETQSGLKYFDLEVGTGAMPSGPNATVKVHYSGWLLDGTKFDSSVDRGDPLEMPLGRLIPGWVEGVQTMKVGGKRKLVIPFDLGYGPAGQGPIPPRATLVFDIELLGTK